MFRGVTDTSPQREGFCRGKREVGVALVIGQEQQLIDPSLSNLASPSRSTRFPHARFSFTNLRSIKRL
jgi:hypothetical protein